MTDPAPPLVLVRGSGDIGSAVAHRLFTAGFPVVIHDEPAPIAPRRGMAFTDAAFAGSSELEGVLATHLNDLYDLEEVLMQRAAVPVATSEFADVLTHSAPDVLVDARMRKRMKPEVQIGLAELTIGLGPNFVAGQHTHWVVETKWCDHLGKVIKHGYTMDLDGEPRVFDGHARDRFVYAPVAGRFRTKHKIADRVHGGDVVAWIDEMPLAAPLPGILRGLVHDGVEVPEGAKVLEVDPRSDPSTVFGIGERPAKIADSVVEAISEWLTQD